MKPKTYAQILDKIVEDQIPGTIDLAPRILVMIGERRSILMRPKLKLATILLLVLGAALALTTIAYALYRWIGDPGLQSVQDARLVTGLDITAQPTILPTNTQAATPQLISNPSLTHTLEGITLTLEWI